MAALSTAALTAAKEHSKIYKKLDKKMAGKRIFFRPTRDRENCPIYGPSYYFY